MAGLTNIYAFVDKEAAKEKALHLLDAGYEVVITGPTAMVRLRDEENNQTFWSDQDQVDVIVLIASQDGIAPVEFND